MTTATVRLTNPTDLLDAIPPLLGFRPEESLVALILQESGRLDRSHRPPRRHLSYHSREGGLSV